MLYTEFVAGGKEYKLRLATRNIISLEKAIGGNPLSIFGNGEEIPSVTTMVNILFYSMQKFQHGISLDDAFSIFDAYLEDHSVTDFISVILDIYKVSGIIKNEKVETDEKNAQAVGE